VVAQKTAFARKWLGSRGNEYIRNNRRTVERSNFYAMRRKDELIGG
jgi:hypothetical protein